ncbi:MAG: hypothetical protein ACRDA5_12080 [Clostridium sp.]
MSKKKKNKRKINKTASRNISNKVVENNEPVVKKSKLALVILLAEVVVAVGLLVAIFTKESAMQLTPFTRDKITWVVYLIIQGVLTFTMFNKKKDDTKWTFHIEATIITFSYLLLG